MTIGSRLIGNWKMNGGLEEVLHLAAVMSEPAPEHLLIGACPPAPLVAHLVAALADTPILVGAQDCHFADAGAHTGDVSARLLSELGARLVILGHSERRVGHGESDALVARKAAAAWVSGLHPIVCVGESLDQREAGKALDVVAKQLQGSLSDLPRDAALTVAYEPVWAIGTGRTPSDEAIVEMCVFIRDWLAHRFSQAVPVLYGGSAGPDNAGRLLGLEGVDGLLVGGASLKPETWRAMIDAAGQVPRRLN